MTEEAATDEAEEFDNSAVIDDGAILIFDIEQFRKATGSLGVVMLEGSVYLVLSDYKLHVLELAKEPFRLTRAAKVSPLKKPE